MSAALDLLKSFFVYSDLEKRLLADYGDPPLIVKHSQIRKISVPLGQPTITATTTTSSPSQKSSPPSQLTLNLRVVHIRHYRGHKLPPLPLVLCLHGLGGQLNQLHDLIDHLTHFAEVVAFDLPGHGRSEAPLEWAAYTPEFLVQTALAVLQATADEPGREVVILAHSMGCMLATAVARALGIRCLGIIAICPPVDIDPGLAALQPKLGYMPTWIFKVFCNIDKLGGLTSPSVQRMVSPHTTGTKEAQAVREKQLRWNLQVKAAAWMKTAYYLRPATREDWAKVECPVQLIGAEDDAVTSPENVKIIASWLGPKARSALLHPGVEPKEAIEALPMNAGKAAQETDEPISSSSSDSSSLSPPSPAATSKDTEELIEPIILHDAGHMCFVEKPQVVSGLISDFIAKYVDVKLSLGWQLAFLASKKDKWSLKNENKWRQVEAVSDLIEGTHFRAMKTLRQDDAEHSPARVEALYPDVTDIIDISRETPPYDPATFTRIVYHKFPTVSKLPPSREEVTRYIALVDSILHPHPDAVIGTHCHYGFNRTGFFLCCYMIERLGFTIKKALLAFRNARNPGIKHSHFIDELYVRYEL